VVLSDVSLLDLGDQLGEGGPGLAPSALGASGDKPRAAVLAASEDSEPDAVVASLLYYPTHGWSSLLRCGVAQELLKARVPTCKGSAN
jgi:hypothetical protein